MLQDFFHQQYQLEIIMFTLPELTAKALNMNGWNMIFFRFGIDG